MRGRAAALRPCARKKVARSRFRWSEAMWIGSEDTQRGGELSYAINFGEKRSVVRGFAGGWELVAVVQRKKKDVDGRLWA